MEPFTWKFTEEELLLPGSGFWTAIGKMPAVEAVPVAVSWVEERKVVERAELLSITCAPETKLVPVMVREKLPRLEVAGEMPVSVGVGLRRVTALDEDLEESAALVAVMVTVLGEGSVEGAA